MICKICNFHTNIFEDTQLKKLYNYCEKCHCIALDKAFFVDEQRELFQYNQHNNSLENEGYVSMFEDFLDFFWEELEAKENALDFGSGPEPVLSQLIKRRGVMVDYFDKFYQPNRCFEGKTYDFITATELFEHLKEPVETLKLLADHLKPNGIIALMTLFHTNKQDDFLTWWYRRDPTHIIFFTPKTMQFMAEKCGLELIKTDGKRIAILKKR